jgi:hypothetical protein
MGSARRQEVLTRCCRDKGELSSQQRLIAVGDGL